MSQRCKDETEINSPLTLGFNYLVSSKSDSPSLSFLSAADIAFIY